MHPYDDDYLSKMMPEFEKKPRQEALAPAPKAASRPADEHVLVLAEEILPPEPPASRIFDAIAAHISRYLACDPHQLTVLTLWAAHTWCFRSSRAAAYLNVRSPEPQSGKSLCLMVLRDLVSNPSFVTGVSAATLIKYLLADVHRVDDNKFNSTILLDACQHTFGPSERQPLVALLNSGSDSNPCYFSTGQEYYFFGPKAFAGNAPLARSLAARCIPITLRRRKPSDVLTRFHQESARESATALVSELIPWISRNRAALEDAAQDPPPRFPLGLTPHEQACAEPLLHLADLIGGSWPDRARCAISVVFQLAESSMTVDLLYDLRAIFNTKNNPAYLYTSDILPELITLEHRPWAGWNRNSGKRLGNLLRPLGITSRGRHLGADKNLKAYFFADLQDAWERYVPPVTTGSASQNPLVSVSAPEVPIVINEMSG